MSRISSKKRVTWIPGKTWKFRADYLDNWTREQQELEKLKRASFAGKFDMFRGNAPAVHKTVRLLTEDQGI